MPTTTAKAAPKKSKPKAQGPLDHLIPSQTFADEYISRKINGVWDIDLLRYSLEAGINVLFDGPTGPGKTSLILAYAAQDGHPLVTIQCNGAVDPDTFWGSWQPKKDMEDDEIEAFLALYNRVKAKMPSGTSPALVMEATVALMDRSQLEYVFSDITNVVKHGGILYLDEVNFLPPKIAAVFHGLFDKRRQIVIPELGNLLIQAHSRTQIVGAYNPDYEGTKPLNAAFKNRFKIKVHMDYDEAVEAELVYIPVMLDLATRLREAQRGGNLDTPTSTNMLVEFEELAVDLGYDFALTNFLNAFHAEERGAVAEVFDLFSDQIQAGVDEMVKGAKTGA